MITLSQRIGSFPTESVAKILPRYLRDYPLRPPINRGSIGDLREEKIGSKISQKISFFPVSATFSVFLSFSLHLFHSCLLWREYQHTRPKHHHKSQLHHRKPAQPPSSHRDSLSLSCRPVSSSFFSATSTSTVAEKAATTPSRGFHP